MDQTTKDIIRLLIDPRDAAARERLLALDAEHLKADEAVQARVSAIVSEQLARYPGTRAQVWIGPAQAVAAAERQAAASQEASALSATK